MKRIITTLLMIGISLGAYAQSKVQEKDILGEWKLVIDVRDEIEDDIREEDNWLAERFAKAVANFALDIIDELDIRMDFREDGEVKIYVDVFGVHETEYASWKINKDGALEIEDDWRGRERRSRKFDISSDHDVWMMDGKKLVAYDRGYSGRLKKQEVYMVKKR